VKISFKIFFFIICIASLVSCKKNPGNASWDINAMAPLINTSLGINNILADSLIQANADSSLKIVYNSTLYSFSVDSLVNIPDTISNQTFISTFGFPVPPGYTLLNQTNNNNLALGNAQVTKIIIKSGYVDLKIRNSLKGKMSCTYQIPYATLNGVPLSVTELVPAGTAASPSTYTTKVDVSGYTLNLTGQNGTGCNTLTSTIHVLTDPNGDTIPIASGDSLRVLASFENIVLDYAKGFFGMQQFQSGQQFSSFKLFNKITSGNLDLENVHLTLNISNGFGIDASLLIHEIRSINNRTGNSVSLNSSIIGSVIHVNRAQETYSSNPVIPISTTFNLDNSNFKQLIENMPDQLEYSIDVTTDPLGNVSSGNDFIYNNYGFNSNLDLEIPLSLVANNLTLTDTVSFHLSKQSGYEINRGTLTLFADNGFPFSANTQIYLLDDSGNKVDSLMTTNNTIASALLGANNKVSSKTKSAIIIPVSGKKLDDLYNAKRMIIVARFNTTNQPSYIKIYSDYLLNIKITGDFNMTIN
jgi:hypothetical protein